MMWVEPCFVPSKCSLSSFTGLKYLRRLNLDRIVTCRMNPLKVRLSWFGFCLFTTKRRNPEISVHIKCFYTHTATIIPTCTGVNDTSFESYNLKDCPFPFLLRFACQRLLKCLLTSQGRVTDFSANPFWTAHVSIFNCSRRNKTAK